MRIQHNIMAMNAYRNYSNNTAALSKNLEKLSSGYKINRAGDDAAGLAISEKMRAQITGLEAAQKNVKDGISLVNTAEGAMQEVQDMLNRMVYLSQQSANGTYDNEVDRKNLQSEVDQLRTEINRIADSANFNGIKLLDGSLADKSAAALSNVTVTHTADALDAPASGQKGVYSIDLSTFTAGISTGGTAAKIGITVGGVTVAETAANVNKGSSITVEDLVAKTGDLSINGVNFNASIDGDKLVLTMKDLPTADYTGQMTVAVTGADSYTANGNQAHPLGVKVEQEPVVAGSRLYAQGNFSLSGKIADGYQLKIGNETYTFAVGKNSKFKNASNVIDMTDQPASTAAATLERIASQRLSVVAENNKMFKVTTQNNDGKVYLTEREGAGIDYDVNNLIGTTTTNHTDATNAAWNGLVQEGMANGSAIGGLTLQIGDSSDSYNQMSVSIGDIHTKALGIGNINIGTQAGAQAAVDVVKNAINYVSSIRGDLGAISNRLDHTANNLSVMRENIQDAESTIRDTDVAEEMMAYTKNNILVQSAQAMLAQANQVPQGVLQLLQ